MSAILAGMPNLTIREAETVEQILQARRNSEIAEALCISEKTVRNHISAIYEKFQVRNRFQLLALAAELGLIGAAPG